MPTIDAIVGDADQEIAALGIEKCRDRLQHGVRHALVVLPILLEAPAQRGFELQVFDSPRLISSSALRWPRRYWSKRKFLSASPKRAVVGDPLVEVEIGIDDLLDHMSRPSGRR